jgi:hypothetical protein
MRSCCYTLSVIIIFIIACNKGAGFHTSCTNSSFTGHTAIHFSELFIDTALLTNDTVLADEPVGFSFSIDGYKTNTINWNVDDGGYTSSQPSFSLRFPPGNYNVVLAVNYTGANACGESKNVTGTVIKKLVVLPPGHASALEGSYEGALDTKPAERFRVTIHYWKHPGDATGNYYLRNYVNGCTGDNIDPQVPPGTGYSILYGYHSFSLYNSYPCNQPGNFKGYGVLNQAGDSITIAHFGYNNAAYVPGDTIPRWHTFKGRRV